MNPLRHRATPAILVGLFFLAATPLQASLIDTAADLLGKSAPTETTETVSDSQAIFTPSDNDPAFNAERQKVLAQRLTDLSSQLIEEVAARSSATADDVRQRHSLLASLAPLYDQLISAQKSLPLLKEEVKQLKEKPVDAQQSFSEKPPFSILFYDRFLSAMEERQTSLELNNNAQHNAKQAVASGSEAVRNAESQWRQLRDEVRQNATPANQWLQENARLAAESARVHLLTQQLKQQIYDLQGENLTLQMKQDEQTRKWIANNLSFTQEQLDQQIKTFDERIATLQDQIQKIEQALEQLEQQKPPVTGNADLDSLNVTLKARQKDRHVKLLEQLRSLMAQQPRFKHLWELRFKLQNQQLDQKDMPAVIEELKNQEKGFESSLIVFQKLQIAIQNRMSNIDKQMGELPPDQGAKRDVVLALQRNAAAELGDMGQAAAELISLRTLNQRILTELEARYTEVPVTEKITGMWKIRTAAILNTELWTSGNYTVRLKALLGALIILLFGITCSRQITCWIVRYASRRFKLDEATAATMSRFTFYLLVLISFLLALNLVNIPLTAFAFLGGAIAIAIGFGAQTLFNNLISGLLLSMNKPFRIGDIIEVDGLTAVVREVGTRSTRLRTFDEKDVIMPNSKVLENRLINWTLTDYLGRGTVKLGVAYGTDAEQVASVMLETIKANPKVLTSPEPWIHFTDFAESALQFTAYFWVNQKVIGAARVESELRFALQKAFAEAGISMPFPQRDVHLNGSLNVTTVPAIFSGSQEEQSAGIDGASPNDQNCQDS